MTALTDFDRLEAPGTWRPEPAAPAADVIVSLGEASLVITDARERALAHWSLAAVERRGPDLYAPGPESSEELRVDDPVMAAAIERVQAALLRRRPGRGRLARAGLAAAAVVGLIVAALWLPDALVRHAAGVAPEATRDALDRALLDRLPPTCATPEGTQALGRLAARLRDGAPLVVLSGGVPATAALPGGTVVLSHRLVEAPQGPDLAAGHILAEEARQAERDPLVALLLASGPLAPLRLLTTGALSAGALDAHAARLADMPPAPADPAALTPRFAAAHLDPGRYAAARGVEIPAPDTTEPSLADGDWVALQGICEG